MRVAFVIDGFNLYHSVKRASKEQGCNCRWLDLRALCSSYLPQLSPEASLQGVYYFSAMAHHVERRNPGTVKRHEAYLRALRATGVGDKLSSFKEKRITYRTDEVFLELLRHEEKETDVAIACRLVELAIGADADAMAVVSADSDLVPAFQTARRLSPEKPVFAIFPAYRGSDALAKAATKRYKIKPSTYARFLLPDPVVAEEGYAVRCPAEWLSDSVEAAEESRAAPPA
jgi:uncharacterized LabA/DUF88 family protein